MWYSPSQLGERAWPIRYSFLDSPTLPPLRARSPTFIFGGGPHYLLDTWVLRSPLHAMWFWVFNGGVRLICNNPDHLFYCCFFCSHSQDCLGAAKICKYVLEMKRSCVSPAGPKICVFLLVLRWSASFRAQIQRFSHKIFLPGKTTIFIVCFKPHFWAFQTICLQNKTFKIK